LIDNWIRLECIVKPFEGGPFIRATIDTAPIRAYLGDVQSLMPDHVEPLLAILRELDAIASRCRYLEVAHSEYSRHGRWNVLFGDHKREIHNTMRSTLCARMNWFLAEMQRLYEFEAVDDRLRSRKLPPLPEYVPT
jgi:hypothetical protein